ncbi:hypothetical protein [Chitiniphilus eburneus]|uniref:Uncharacterized protein n=1 Tax=Chitiniphilus eburneus TaxID=2571148 RepID=A0A4U0PX95_9NEIS|nr:hypothetical protein [Chitiniphilus eburneus]TJZ73206.1 hypothetical protein FAZ21_11350 [Chitiniphilus eburneus]
MKIKSIILSFLLFSSAAFAAPDISGIKIGDPYSANALKGKLKAVNSAYAIIEVKGNDGKLQYMYATNNQKERKPSDEFFIFVTDKNTIWGVVRNQRPKEGNQVSFKNLIAALKEKYGAAGTLDDSKGNNGSYENRLHMSWEYSKSGLTKTSNECSSEKYSYTAVEVAPTKFGDKCSYFIKVDAAGHDILKNRRSVDEYNMQLTSSLDVAIFDIATMYSQLTGESEKKAALEQQKKDKQANNKPSL